MKILKISNLIIIYIECSNNLNKYKNKNKFEN